MNNLPASLRKLPRRQVLCGLASVPLLTACTATAPNISQANVRMSSRRASRTKIEVIVDPRIELMTVIQRLAGYFVLSPYETFSSREVDQHFRSFKNHPVVETYGELTDLGFAFDKVPRFMMHFDAEPGFELVIDWRSMAGGSADLERTLELFAAQMRDFSYRSEFHDRFLRKDVLHAEMVEAVSPKISGLALGIEDFTGTPVGDATLVLGPQIHDGGFAAYFPDMPRGPKAFAFVGPSSASGGVPDFGSRQRLFELVTHEFLHLTVNPLTERHIASINPLGSMFEPIAEAMTKQAYGNWQTAFDEHVVRAMTVRIAERTLGKQWSEQLAQAEFNRGFKYLPAVLRSLARFERSRETFPSLATYYPQLIEEIANAS